MSCPARPDLTFGSTRLKTSSVAATANTPSLKASARVFLTTKPYSGLRGAAEKPSTELRRPCGPSPGSATALLAHACTMHSLRCSSLHPDLGHLDRRISRRRFSAAPLTKRLHSPPDDKQRRGVEDRAVRTRHDPDEQCEGKALQRRATSDQDRRQDEDDREARDDRPRRGLHDAEVHHLLEGKPLADAKVFADPVEHDDRVVHRE